MLQVVMAIGAPWGHLAMGGRYPGKYPIRIRVAALVQAVLLALLAVIVLIRARIILPDFFEATDIGIWVVVAIYGISLVMNLITASKWEKILWVPVALILTVGSLVIALCTSTCCNIC
jgi:hypothetical protein